MTISAALHALGLDHTDLAGLRADLLYGISRANADLLESLGGRS